MARATLSVDATLWRRFRSACLLRGSNASREIDAFMQRQVDEWQAARDEQAENVLRQALDGEEAKG